MEKNNENINIQKKLEATEYVREYMRAVRKKVDLKNQSNSKDYSREVIFTECRKGFFNGDYVNRLVVFMRGTGCSQVKEIGGCTFCGFYNATNLGEKVQDDDYINQVNTVINDRKNNFSEYSVICLYNDGSLLCEEEISFDVLIKIIGLLNRIESIKKIVIESRVENITEEKLIKLRETTYKQFEIAVGFESANPDVRDLCINKSFDTNVFEHRVYLAKKYNISIIPLLMVKPPFLTEIEAIQDFTNSLQYLEKFDLKRIDIELPTVEKNTLTYELWKRDMYKPIKLWSVIEILKRRDELGLKTPIYISPMNYSVSAEQKSSNCEACSETVYDIFEKFNKTLDFSVFNEFTCSCKEEWEELLEKEKNEYGLTERVLKIINKLNELNGGLL